MENLTFGAAIEATKKGKRISRIGWNGKGMFVFVVPETKSDIFVFSDSVQNFFLQKEQTEVVLTSHLCLYGADGNIVVGWVASQSDVLSTDWQILDQ